MNQELDQIEQAITDEKLAKALVQTVELQLLTDQRTNLYKCLSTLQRTLVDHLDNNFCKGDLSVCLRTVRFWHDQYVA